MRGSFVSVGRKGQNDGWISISKKVIHIHFDLIILVWKDQQSFYLHHFHIIILLVLFSVYHISIHCFVIEVQYNHVLTL